VENRVWYEYIMVEISELTNEDESHKRKLRK